MKKRQWLALLTGAAMACFAGCSAEVASLPADRESGEFSAQPVALPLNELTELSETTATDWTGYGVSFYRNTAGTSGLEDGVYKIKGETVDGTDWHIKFEKNFSGLEAGRTYSIEFAFRSNVAGAIRLEIGGLLNREYPIAEGENVVTGTFTMPSDSTERYIDLQLGTLPQGFEIAVSRVTLYQATAYHVVDDFNVYVNEAAAATKTVEENGCGIEIVTSPDDYWKIKYERTFTGLTAGETYAIEYVFDSTAAGSVKLEIGGETTDFNVREGENVVTGTFTMPSDSTGYIDLQLGKLAAGTKITVKSVALLQNGAVQELSGFGGYFNNDNGTEGTANIVDGAYVVNATKTTGEAWHIKLDRTVQTVVGRTYSVSYRLVSDRAGKLAAEGGSGATWLEVVADEPTTLTHTFKATEENTYLALQLGELPSGFTVRVESVTVEEVAFTGIGVALDSRIQLRVTATDEIQTVVFANGKLFGAEGQSVARQDGVFVCTGITPQYLNETIVITAFDVSGNQIGSAAEKSVMDVCEMYAASGEPTEVKQLAANLMAYGNAAAAQEGTSVRVLSDDAVALVTEYAKPERVSVTKKTDGNFTWTGAHLTLTDGVTVVLEYTCNNATGVTVQVNGEEIEAVGGTVRFEVPAAQLLDSFETTVKNDGSVVDELTFSYGVTTYVSRTDNALVTALWNYAKAVETYQQSIITEG